MLALSDVAIRMTQLDMACVRGGCPATHHATIDYFATSLSLSVGPALNMPCWGRARAHIL